MFRIIVLCALLALSACSGVNENLEREDIASKLKERSEKVGKYPEDNDTAYVYPVHPTTKVIEIPIGKGRGRAVVKYPHYDPDADNNYMLQKQVIPMDNDSEYYYPTYFDN